MLIFSVYMQNNAISCQLELELKNVHEELEKCQFAPYTKQITISEPNKIGPLFTTFPSSAGQQTEN